jgi:hypothetical protein
MYSMATDADSDRMSLSIICESCDGGEHSKSWGDLVGVGSEPITAKSSIAWCRRRIAYFNGSAASAGVIAGTAARVAACGISFPEPHPFERHRLITQQKDIA